MPTEQKASGAERRVASVRQLPRLNPSVQGVYEHPRGEYLKRDAVLACVEAVEERLTELLGVISAHEAEKAHGPTSNMEHADSQLYEHAERLRAQPDKEG